MAHLLVTNETVVIDQPHQENIGRGNGKHKRAGHEDDVELTCYEGSVWPGSDTTKRRALAPITNHVFAPSNRQFGGSSMKKPATSQKADLSFCSSLVTCIILI